MGLKAAKRLDSTFAALADPYRRRVVDLLRESPRRAGELAELTGLPPAAMSRHLRTLRRSGVVEESHPDFDARVRIYALKPEFMADLKAWLKETEALWTKQLLHLKQSIEDEEADA